MNKIGAVRLTNKIFEDENDVDYDISAKNMGAVIKKLGQLEDFMERHAYHSIEELEQSYINSGNYIANKDSVITNLIYENQDLKKKLENAKSRVKYFVGYDDNYNRAVVKMNLDVILPEWMHDKGFVFYDTEEEAQQALEKLKGENK